jgi:hypothetical protein
MTWHGIDTWPSRHKAGNQPPSYGKAKRTSLRYFLLHPITWFAWGTKFRTHTQQTKLCFGTLRPLGSTKIIACWSDLSNKKAKRQYHNRTKVPNFNYVGRQLGSNRYYVLQNKLQSLNYLWGTIKRALLNKSQRWNRKILPSSNSSNLS